jgi:hypothetical protein
MKIYSSKILLYILGIITVGVVIYFVSKNIKKKNIEDRNKEVENIKDKLLQNFKLEKDKLLKNFELKQNELLQADELVKKLELENNQLKGRLHLQTYKVVEHVKNFINNSISEIKKVKSEILSVIGSPNNPDYPSLSIDFKNLDEAEKKRLNLKPEEYSLDKLNSIFMSNYYSEMTDIIHRKVQKQIQKETLIKDFNLFITKLIIKIDKIKEMNLRSEQNIEEIESKLKLLNSMRKYTYISPEQYIDISQLNKYLTDWLPGMSNKLDQILIDELKLNTQSEYYRYVL